MSGDPEFPVGREYTPLVDGVKVIPEVLARGYRRIALVFLHGLGDTLMFRSVFAAFQKRLVEVEISVFLLENQVELLDAGKPWHGEDSLRGYDASFIIQFPMSEGSGVRKADFCAIHELGLDGAYEIAPLQRNVRAIVAVHFQGTALPGLVNASADVCRAIYDAIVKRGYLPVETHFEHPFHNPVNSKFEWISTTVRGNEPSIDKLYSIIDSAACFIGVASGPLVMALAIDPTRVIYLQNEFSLANYSTHAVPTIDVKRFDKHEFEEILNRQLPSLVRPNEFPDEAISMSDAMLDATQLELRILRAKSELSISDREIINPVLQVEHEHFPEYFSSNRYYGWYYALGKAMRPRRIAEIGVRYGYSLFSLASGSASEGGPDGIELFGFDNESYNLGSCAVAEANLRQNLKANVQIRKCSSTSLEDLGIADIDLFHVDGDHSRAGAIWDCNLALKAVRPGGLILLDDVDSVPDVRSAGDAFCDSIGTRPIYIPTFRGMYVIQKPV